jgi:serine/threonine protein kinase
VDGVDYCHRRGVCHRDLKPENLPVVEKGPLKITDFRCYTMKGGTHGMLYTTVGTPKYPHCYAPKNILSGADVGYSDVMVDA